MKMVMDMLFQIIDLNITVTNNNEINYIDEETNIGTTKNKAKVDTLVANYSLVGALGGLCKLFITEKPTGI